jgi:hypothetical protein
MATVKIWWHDGSTLDVRNHPTPLINEPEVAFESVVVGAVPVSTGPAPEESVVCVIESPVPLRYRVRVPGGTGLASDVEAKRIAATGTRNATIGVQPGFTISLLEEV